MVKLDAEKFLGELGQLYSANRKESRRAVWLTIKRTYPKLDGMRGAKRKAALHSDGDKTDVVACLIRATNGKKKVATEIDAETASHFAGALMNVVRLNADDVREREPAAKRRKRQDAAAATGDGGGSAAAVNVAVDAGTKGAGDSSNNTQKSAQRKAKKQRQKEAAIAHQHQREGARRQHARGDKREPPTEQWGK